MALFCLPQVGEEDLREDVNGSLALLAAHRALDGFVDRHAVRLHVLLVVARLGAVKCRSES